jgi:hypothetical protein
MVLGGLRLVRLVDVLARQIGEAARFSGQIAHSVIEAAYPAG